MPATRSSPATAKPSAVEILARRIVEASAELAGGRLNRMTSVDRIVEHLDLKEDSAAIDAAIMFAVFRLWLRTNPGKILHSVIVAPGWRLEQEFQKEKTAAPARRQKRR